MTAWRMNAMSDSTGLIVIPFLGLMSAFCIFYLSTIVNAAGDQVATGFVGDHRIPTRQRWLMLYSRWVSYLLGAVTVPLFLAIAAVVIASHVGDANVKLLAYLLAFFMVVSSLLWLAQGGVQFLAYRTVLREDEPA